MENVPSFQPFFVYSKPTPEEIELGDAWYEVGTDYLGSVIGWMRYDDVFEWKQTMCLAFTHPEGRKPVLMFEKKNTLHDLIVSSADERVKSAEELYATIDSKEISQDFPVISLEPKKAVDFTEQFYLLPILDFQTIEIDGREGRLVKLAAVTGEGPNSRKKSDIRDDKGYLDDALGESTQVDEDTLKQLTVDLVWVMDTTVSMRPHILQTLEVINNTSTQITQDKELAESLHFGIWGYRDNLEDIPDIGYTTKNYTPELQTIDQFKETLATVRVTTTDSVDYEEDMFSGMSDAIVSTKWTPDAIRIIVLVGDAPGHELGHKWNISQYDENTLHKLAKGNTIFISAIHIREPKANRYHEKAETQFLTLSRNEGQGGESAYYDIAAENIVDFNRVTTEFVGKISKLVYDAKKGILDGKKTETAGKTPTSKLIKAEAILGQGVFNNEPNLILNGTVPEQGYLWRGNECVYWSGSEQFFTIDLGDVYMVDNVLIQIDNNDDMQVDSSIDGQEYKPLLSIQSDKGEIDSGMDTFSTDAEHPQYVEGIEFDPLQVRYLKVYAKSGDNMYAVSELQAFGTPITNIPSQIPKVKGEMAFLSTPENESNGKIGSDSPANIKEDAPKGEMAFLENAETITASGEQFNSLIKAAFVKWVGKMSEARSPSDIEAWVVDKDLIKPDIPSLEVRLLINKRQLDSLKTVLSDVMSAGRGAQFSGEDFFSALQATAATTARDPDKIINAKNMVQTDLLPEFLVGLPYKSRLMEVQFELWSSWSVDAQDEILNELDGKIKAYQSIHDTPEGWIQLNQGDDPDEHVYPISLELLP
ncbi:MAG: hypothetical protein SCALA701_06000 [Candidatus Scalindua sp.]|nr:MAG: hypothetical protein SCALA701_06000 [Candidatus Scalindua sp.]